MLYKLIILYMLNKVDIPLTANQIINYVLEQGYTDYITIQQTIGELIEDGFIATGSMHHTAMYTISDAGSSTLKMFQDTISPVIREEIDTYLRINRYKFLEDRSTTAEYTTEDDNEYRVYLSICERGQIIMELQIVVPTLETAEKYCENWKKKSAEAYEYALRILE